MPQAVDDDYVYGICTFTEMRIRVKEGWIYNWKNNIIPFL